MKPVMQVVGANRPVVEPRGEMLLFSPYLNFSLAYFRVSLMLYRFQTFQNKSRVTNYFVHFTTFLLVCGGSRYRVHMGVGYVKLCFSQSVWLTHLPFGDATVFVHVNIPQFVDHSFSISYLHLSIV